MKCIYVLCLVVLTSIYAKELYTPENDNFDIEAAYKNGQIPSLNGCFVDTEECDSVSADFKKDISEAVKESCAKCTDDQKHLFKRFMEIVKRDYTKDYELFKNKYDPEGKYLVSLEAAVAKF